MAQDLFEAVQQDLALVGVGIDDVGVTRNGGDRQMMAAKRLSDLDAFLFCDLPVCDVHILEMHVQLHAVEVMRPNNLGGLFQGVGEVA